MSQTGAGRAPAVRPALGAFAVLIGSLAVAAPEAAQAQPSFDCANAARPSEVAICASPALSALDREIADIFFALMEVLPQTQAAQLQHRQRAFLRDRDGCVATASGDALDACLQEAMQHRLATLQSLHTEISNRPLVIDGEVIAAPGMHWRPVADGQLPDRTYRFTNGAVLCAVDMPDRPTLGVAGADGGPCQYADGGGAAVSESYHVLLADTEYGWASVRSVNQIPENAVVVWRDHDERVSVCRAELQGTQYIGTLTHAGACTVLHTDDTTVPVTEVLLFIAGFEVMAE